MQASLRNAEWRKSSHSGGSGNCVEVGGNLAGAVGVRDSKDPAGPALVFTTNAWLGFISRLKSGNLSEQRG